MVIDAITEDLRCSAQASPGPRNLGRGGGRYRPAGGRSARVLEAFQSAGIALRPIGNGNRHLPSGALHDLDSAVGEHRFPELP